VPDGRQPTSHKDQRRHSAPLAVQEMVLAMLLIAKGFNRSAAVAPRWRTV
jgi:hypothetical protein